MNRNSSKKEKGNTISKIKNKPNNEYFENKKCGNSKTEVCITNSEYKQMCNKAKGITTDALRMEAVQFSSAYGRFLHTDGNYGNQRISFNKGTNRCTIYFEISGMYKGTSKREVFNKRAMSFIVTKKGKVLIGYFQ
jgi:hypothetical protein|tara:strand:- start:95 stop:502 length:408 start_codon:yes stop_codon:yes gene_type:complete